MSFKTIEEANEFALKVNNEINEYKQQIDNQKTKIAELTTNFENANKEIDRLKIKNYEYYEQISQGASKDVGSNSNDVEETFTLDDLINNL